jgi:hypothetical protein
MCGIDAIAVAPFLHGAASKPSFHKLPLQEQARLAVATDHKINGCGLASVLVKDLAVIVLERRTDCAFWPRNSAIGEYAPQWGEVVLQYHRTKQVEHHCLAAQAMVDEPVQGEALSRPSTIVSLILDVSCHLGKDDVARPVLPFGQHVGSAVGNGEPLVFEPGRGRVP